MWSVPIHFEWIEIWCIGVISLDGRKISTRRLHVHLQCVVNFAISTKMNFKDCLVVIHSWHWSYNVSAMIWWKNKDQIVYKTQEFVVVVEIASFTTFRVQAASLCLSSIKERDIAHSASQSEMVCHFSFGFQPTKNSYKCDLPKWIKDVDVIKKYWYWIWKVDHVMWSSKISQNL